MAKRSSNFLLASGEQGVRKSSIFGCKTNFFFSAPPWFASSCHFVVIRSIQFYFIGAYALPSFHVSWPGPWSSTHGSREVTVLVPGALVQ